MPHPTPRLVCEDVSVLGAFMMMDVVDGSTPGFRYDGGVTRKV